MSDLKPCPCGIVPKELVISRSADGYKWAFVSANCCGDWDIEFRTGGHDLDSEECMNEAIAYWNNAKRNQRDDGWIKCSDRLPDVIGYYLACSKYKIYWVFFNSEKKWCNDNNYINDIVTHWKPLPPKPE